MSENGKLNRQALRELSLEVAPILKELVELCGRYKLESIGSIYASSDGYANMTLYGQDAEIRLGSDGTVWLQTNEVIARANEGTE